MDANLQGSIEHSIVYLREHGIDIPHELYVKAYGLGALKAVGDLPAIMATYHDLITETLIEYFESKNRPVTSFRNRFWQAAVGQLGAAFDLGWKDGGGSKYPTGDALDWYNARIDREMGYISTLFQEAKELRKEADFDYFAWTNQRADGYTRTIKELYNVGKMRASKDIMVTFTGSDGEESCPECQKLKGSRHRVSWFVRRNYVPPHGTGLSCHRGRRCMHYLENDKGERITA